MSDPFKPILFLCVSVAMGSLCLWLLIGHFLGSTDDVAASLARRAAQGASQNSVTTPLSADRQRRAELLEQIRTQSASEADQATQGASSEQEGLSVASATVRNAAERADSDDDIEAQKSIEALQLAMADGQAVPVEPQALEASRQRSTGVEPAALTTAPVKPQPVLAVDVSLDLADHCEDRRADAARIGVFFRPRSAAIKGRSLTELDSLVAAARACESSVVIIETRSAASADTDLQERRSDEIKYYLLQRGIDKAFMRFEVGS